MDVLFSILLLVMQAVSGQPSGEPSLLKTVASSIAVQQGYLAAQAAGDGEAGGQQTGEAFASQDPQPDAPVVKGIYATAHSAGGARLETLLQLIDGTDLNALVIDIKDDFGYITYPTETESLLQLGEAKRYIRDIAGLMEQLEAHDVYPIARIVVFKDSVLAAKRPDLSFVNEDGTVWTNGRGESFVNPYVQEVWDYNIAIAEEAVALGFKEIQFDYVRFPEGFEKRADTLDYEQTELSRVEAVSGFVAYAKQKLQPLGVRVSVDIFGYAASVPAAEGIGQDFEQISANVDVISPMVYPSHYSTGWFGQKTPDKAPYETIFGSMADTHKKLEALENKPIIRPWIQDFTASWLGKGNYTTYGVKEVEAQIAALKDSDIHEYLLWNAGNKYTAGVTYK